MIGKICCYTLGYWNCHTVIGKLHLFKPQEERKGISLLIAALQKSLEKISNLIAGGGAEKCCEQEHQSNDPQGQTLMLIKEMDETIQEIEQHCREQEWESAIEKTKETLKSLRLACEESNSTGHCNLLPFIEELQETVAALKKISEKEQCGLVEESETAF